MTNQHSPTTYKPSHLQLFLFILIGTIIAFGVSFLSQKPATPSPESSNVVNSQLQTVTQGNIVFYSQTFLDRSQTFISIPYTFDSPQPPLIWLKLETGDNETKIHRLINHPQFNQLTDWQQFSFDSHTYLYTNDQSITQANDVFDKSINSQNTFIETSLQSESRFSRLNALNEHQSLDLSAINYIITTYIPNRFDPETNLLYYETILDTTHIPANDKGELVWIINATDISDSNPLYIGNIHVDYR